MITKSVSLQTFRSNLVFGVHLGKSEIRRELPGFSVSVLQPTFHAEDVALHTHDSASLIFVLEGVYRTSADGPTKLSSGALLVSNPQGTTHRDSFVGAVGRFMAVSVSDPVTRIAKSNGNFPQTAISFLVGEPIAAAKRLLREIEAGDLYDSSLLEGACWELLAAVSGTSCWGEKDGTAAPSWLTQARAMLHDRRTEVLPITGIADELGIHPVYFARRFRQHFRCSPAAYRMRCRLQAAMALLCRSDQSLLEIALNAGFFDQSHFTTAFRRQFGHAPGIYRSRL